MNQTLRAAALGSFLFFTLTEMAWAKAAKPELPILSAIQIKHDCDRQIAQVRKAYRQVAQARKSAPNTILSEMNTLNILIEDLASPLFLTANVSPDKATREQADACTVKWAAIDTEIFQNEAIYKRVKRFMPKDPIQSAYREELIHRFEDSGVSLPPAKRARTKQIVAKLIELSNEFDKAVREDKTKVAFTAQELEGVPSEVLKGMTADAQGRYSLGLDYPTYSAVMQNAISEATRERMWRAKTNEGGEGNLALLDQISQLRRELAKLYGYPSFAAFSLRRKMARNPDNVLRFLAQVKEQVSELEKRELEELRLFKAQKLNQPLADTRFHRWDLSYFQEQYRRERFKINQEEIRKYFPTQVSVNYMLRLSEKLYGLRFVEREAKVWHPDVKVVDVLEASDGKFIGSIYLDLFPREGKYNHAAVWPVRNGSTLVGRTPIPALVTNLNRNGLTQEELETLLHEFGHALHGVLSQTIYNAQAGTNTLMDFVEAPSQMFEEWGRRAEPLRLLASLCGTCPVLSDEQIESLRRARNFGRGINYARQWVYAAFDMALTHDPKATNAMETWKKIEGSTPLGYVEGTRFPAGFSHLVGGYAAGYYGYMWSEVMALDMLSAFGGKLLSEDVGRRYRQTILSQGGQRPPHLLVEQFLGRAPNNEAFFKEITGQR